jgi:hypothetical protein
MLDSGKVSSVEFQTDRIVVLTKEEAEKPQNQQKLYYTGIIPNVDLTPLTEKLTDSGITYNEEIVEQTSPIVTFIVSWVIPIVIMYALFSLLMRSMTKRMGGGLGGIGESKAKVYMEKQTGVTFADVAGQDEAKESLVEIIDFLHNPQKYTAIGAKLPACCWSAPGHRQDAAGQGHRRRGQGAVLQHLRLRLRRDVRRRRRQPRARHVRAGQEERALHHLHRRDRRRRPPAWRRPGRRQRRARADAQPDAGRDGRLRDQRGRHRDGGHQPARHPRPGAAAPGPLRPPPTPKSASCPTTRSATRSSPRCRSTRSRSPRSRSCRTPPARSATRCRCPRRKSFSTPRTSFSSSCRPCWAAAPPSRSSSASRRPARRTTLKRPPILRAKWSRSTACPSASASWPCPPSPTRISTAAP